MQGLGADTRKPQYAIRGLPERRLVHEFRFVVGIAIALGGAGALLSDLIHLAPSLG